MSQVINELVRVENYSALLKAVRTALSEGRDRAFRAVEQEKVRTAWEVGRLINRHVLEMKRAGYAEQVIIRLAKDLTKSQSELYYMMEFARAYPIFPHAGKLSWSAYRDLLAVNEPVKRKALVVQAVKESWSRDRLRDEVRSVTKKMTSKPLTPPMAKLTAKPGKVGLYRVIRAKAGPYVGELVIDLGFSNYFKPVKRLSVRDRQIVSAFDGHVRSTKGAADDDLFTYAGYGMQVIDGDTFDALIDLGFGFITKQTLRLRGLDAPEMNCADGVAAKRGLEKILAKTGRVIVRTTKSDKYDRYLADVFVPRLGSDEFLYVNQELVSRGFADVTA